MVDLIGAVFVWIGLILTPLSRFDLLWPIIPVYVNGVLAEVYLKASHVGAVFSGFIMIWVGADWIRRLMMRSIAPDLSLEWSIIYFFLIYGLVSIYVGIIQHSRFHYIFGRRRIVTYFAISFYPIQVGLVPLTTNVLYAILIMFVPIFIIMEIIPHLLRSHLPEPT